MKPFAEMNNVQKAQYLNEKFFIDSRGNLFHREFTHHSQKVGELGSDNGNGYLRVGVDGSMQLVHRIVFALTHGFWPENDVDHVNGDRADNRPANLQEASQSCNSRKAEWSAGNSGVRGVERTGDRWRAQVQVSNKLIHGKCRPTRGMALIDWCDMTREVMSAEDCQAPQLAYNFSLAERYIRMFGDYRDGPWDDKRGWSIAAKQSNVRGVYWDKTSQKWRARVTVSGKRKYLGYFTEELEAAAAVEEFKAALAE